MKLTVFILSLVFFTGASAKFDLDAINRVLTRIVDKEVQEVAECFQTVLKCDTNKQYPDCLDTPENKITIDTVDIDVGQFFVIDIFNMVLEGTMHLKDTKFHGLSSFEITDITSSVTVVPLGIEFKFTLLWKDNVDFKSKYDLKDIVYKKSGANTKMSGAGENMDIHFKGLGYKVVAHKILGGIMDYMKIDPMIEEFSVGFDEINLGDKSLLDLVKTKFNPKFIRDINYERLAEYAKDFFNESLYPGTRQTRAIDNKLLQKLGKCIKDYFPE